LCNGLCVLASAHVWRAQSKSKCCLPRAQWCCVRVLHRHTHTHTHGAPIKEDTGHHQKRHTLNSLTHSLTHPHSPTNHTPHVQAPRTKHDPTRTEACEASQKGCGYEPRGATATTTWPCRPRTHKRQSHTVRSTSHQCSSDSFWLSSYLLSFVRTTSETVMRGRRLTKT
jgi:hypothetical protein